MRLISKEFVGRISFAGKSYDSFVRLVSRSFQCFKYAYVVHILVFLYFIWFVCFYDLLGRIVLRTLWIFWKPFQQLETTAEKCSGNRRSYDIENNWKITNPSEILWECLKECFFGRVVGPQFVTLSKNKLLYKYFFIDWYTI